MKKPTKLSNVRRILNFIRAAGDEGVSLTEIQFYIWTEIKGYVPEEFWEIEEGWAPPGKAAPKLRKTRGWYCDPLYGYWAYEGLLYKFCKKSTIKKRNWVIDRYPDKGEAILTRPNSYSNKYYYDPLAER